MGWKMRLTNLIRPATLAAALALVTFTSSQAEIEDNAGYRQAFTNWAAAHLALLPTSFLPGPFGAAADLATIGIDIRIKTLPPVLRAFDANSVRPNSPDECHYSFLLPQIEAEYSNLLGIADTKSLPSNWGAFSNNRPPEVEHANADVKLRVQNFFLNQWTPSAKTVVYPSGSHSIKWQAATQIDPLLDLVVPFALFVITNEVKYFKAFFDVQTDPKTAARALEIGLLFLINAGIEAEIILASQIENDRGIDTATHDQFRIFPVLDVNPPNIIYQPAAGIDNGNNPVVLEANSLGGERWDQHKDLFRTWIIESDPCDQPLSVGNDAPVLLPIGTNFVEWEALDSGPLGPGNNGRATLRQKIEVQDTRAPILLVPPARVVESMDPATPAEVDIGTAVMFDVADPDPTLSNTVPSIFPVNSRTEVLWTATDGSGNSDSRSQWITVKAPGSNSAPSVNNANASALTGQAIDIELSGSDPDFLSGRFDPLMFDIESGPANGFFVAPLVPYFIEDYRVSPNEEIGLILSTSSNPINDIADRFCGSGGPGIPTDFVYQPEFVHVTDDGSSFVLDRRFECQTSGAQTRPRISKWSPTGELLAENTGSGIEQAKRLTLDDQGRVYTAQPEQNDLPLIFQQFDSNLNVLVNRNLEAPSGRLLDAKLDLNSGLIYATNKSQLFVYDGRDEGFRPPLLGTLKDGEFFLSGQPSVAGSSSRGFNIELDSTGNVYIVDSGSHRIHKFAPSTIDGSSFLAGAHIGWLGRCDSGPGCDDENGRSIGFSCSDTTPCVVSTTAGDGEGQFNTPTGIAFDPEDVLYVTDYDNSRVQRFTTLGDFAGEAGSTCDGSCFVLGDMGRPLDISVNSSMFFVLDRDRDLMHVFETAPFKDITENSVVVSYASDNSFQGTDSFTYRASDGLADSNLGTATISVARNFRPPEAFDSAVTLNEDETAEVNLLGADPDGIAGIDFNGLDTLSYSVIQAPLNGQLNGSGEMLTYVPNPDFNGNDQLVYQVGDGTFTSAPATISLTVNPVNDVPTVRFMDDGSKMLPKGLTDLLKGRVVNNGLEAGLGFPVPLMAEFDDPDLGQSHFLQISWGDGDNDSANQNPPADPQAPREDPIITSAFGGTGQAIAEHVYLAPGVFDVEVLVIDELGAGSDPGLMGEVTVLPMVDVALEALPVSDEPAAPGQITRLMINVSNELPQAPVEGLPATSVEFTGTLPQGVELVSFETSKGSCGHDLQITTCLLGTLAPGEVETIIIAMLPEINFDPESLGYTIDVTSAERDATGTNTTVVEVPVLPQLMFRNGFE